MTNEGNTSFKHVKAAADAAAVVAAARITPKLRKSCDFCCMRKRRCDGKRPCSFCVDRGRNCNFSFRKPTRLFRAKNLSGHAAYHAGVSCLGGGLEASDALLVEGDYTINMKGGYGPRTAGASYPLRLKRPSLSASPATGLVGLEENAFLGTFFSCLGFLPLACERTVRQGLVDTMLGARRKRAEQLKQSLACEVAAPGTAGVDADAISRRDPSTPESALPGASRSLKDEGHPRSDAAAQEEHDKVDYKDDGANDSPRAAAVCELWCAIAIGALIQGQPPERVASYKFSAWTALSKCFDRIAPETARAYAVMAYLHNFLRNDKMFYRYLKMAKGIVDVLSPEEAQTAQNIEQVLMKIVDKRMFHTSSLNRQELGLLCENYCKDELPPLKVPSIIQKEKLCNLLVRADVKMYQAFLRDWRKHEQPAAADSSRQRKREDGRPPLDATTPRTPDADRHSANPDVSALLEQEKEEDVSKGEGRVTPAEEAFPLGAGKIGDGQVCRPRLLPAPTDNVMTCVQECMELFGRMKETARPEISNGAGGLLVKAFQGFMEIRGGDKRVGARNIIECADILVAFPGLCRFSRWSHTCHCLLGFLAAMGGSDRYEKLRQAYNKVLIGNAPAVPPLEEWSVATVCDHIFCEDSEASVKMHMGATRRSAEVTQSESVTVARGSKDGETARQQQEKLEWQQQQRERQEQHQAKQWQKKRAEEHREQPRRAEVTRSESATVARGSVDGEAARQQQQRERQEQHQEKQWHENRAVKHREQPHQKKQRRQQEMDEHKKRQRQQLQQQEEQRQREEEQRQQLQQQEEQQQLQRQQQLLQRQQQELQRQQMLLQRQQQELQRQQQLQQQQDQLQRLEEQAKKQGHQQHLQRQQQRHEQQQQQLQRQRQLRWQQQQQPQQECQQHQPKRNQVGMELVQEPAGVLSRQSFFRGACPEDCPTTTSLWEYEVPHHGYEAIPEFPNKAFLTRGPENQEALVCAAGSARDREPGSSSTNTQASSRDPQTVLLPSGGASPSPMQLLPIGYGVEDCCTYYHHRGKQNGDERYGTEHNSNDHHCG